MKIPALTLLAVAALLAWTTGATAHDKLGEVHWPISCTPAAQVEFDRALAMLHAFWLPQATRAFEKVAAADPGCAMAQWGIAMGQRGNPLVGAPAPAASEAGWAAVQRARALGAQTPRERDAIAALETYFKDWPSVEHGRRVLDYERAMEQLALRYPSDPEVTTLYALALNEAITVLPADKTYARHLKAAAILEKVLAEHPDHPGALHYLIHSYDFPPLATRGLPAARRYDVVASSAPHALHMPSHIYSMVGMWQESIRSNRAALGVAATYAHAMDFLVYAFLQGAQDAAARQLVDEAATLFKKNAPATALTPTAGVLAVHTAFAAIPARFAIERGAWSEALALTPQPTTPVAQAITHFARAMGAIRSGSIPSARPDIQQLAALRDDLARAKQDYWAEQVEIQRRAAVAWAALAEGRRDEALQGMRAAADLEDASEKHVAMENRLWPMRELLGELLLELNRPAEAFKAFEASLQVSRNRFRGLSGAARAAELAGDADAARTYYARLVSVGQHADADRAELRHARAFLSRR